MIRKQIIKYPVTLLVLLALAFVNILSSQTTVDGPHVFYKGDEITVSNFMVSPNLCEMDEQKFAADDFISLYCKIDPAGKVGFKFPLRKTHKPEPSVYPQPDKIFAISDIEGNFKAFATTLKSNGIIDDQFKWNYGNGHLVLVGDFFDRGPHVTACLWLIYKLESEAKSAGGQVHFILGNHEEMNMRGDDRFAVKKYKRVAEKLEFAVRDLYEKNTELGRWLRTKNVVEKIGNTLFTHGGISPAFANNGLSLKRVNQIAHQFMGESYKLIELQSGNDKKTPMVFHKSGPLWYRGYFKEPITQAKFDEVLNAYDVEQIVVGHTIVEKIEPMFKGKLIPIDVKHRKHLKSGEFNAIEILDGNKVEKVNAKGKREELSTAISVSADDNSMADNAPTEVVDDNNVPEGRPQQVSVPTKQQPTEANDQDIPAVLSAIENENMLAIKGYLFDHDIDAPIEGQEFTLLHFAIGRGKTEIVKFLMDQDADPDVMYKNKTALMYAVKENKPPIIKYLVDLGINVKVTNKKNQTALHYAAKYSIPLIAKLLAESGCPIQQQDYKGRTPLQTAEQYKNIPVAQYLKSLER